MRNPVRKFVGVAVIGVLGALFALPMALAGAQTVGAPPAPTCTILSVTPNPVTAFPSTITVTGTVESGVHITLYGQTPPGTGSTVALASQDVTDGTFSLSANLTAPTNVSVNFTYGNQNAYTAGCSTVSGEVVVLVKAAEAARTPTGPSTAAALAFTGSSDTPSYVLIGIAAVVIGAVLVVAARRRSHLS